MCSKYFYIIVGNCTQICGVLFSSDSYKTQKRPKFSEFGAFRQRVWVGSSGLEPLTSALSKQRSEPTELTSFETD